MLTELWVLEQPFLAVKEVLDGAKITDIVGRYGVDRRTVHRWVVRYATDGLGNGVSDPYKPSDASSSFTTHSEGSPRRDADHIGTSRPRPLDLRTREGPWRGWRISMPS